MNITLLVSMYVGPTLSVDKK